jgi:hypothetical protein
MFLYYLAFYGLFPYRTSHAYLRHFISYGHQAFFRMTVILLFHILEKYYHYKSFIFFQDLCPYDKGRFFQFRAETKNVILPQNITALSGNQPATYSMGSGENFPARKAADSEAGH